MSSNRGIEADYGHRYRGCRKQQNQHIPIGDITGLIALSSKAACVTSAKVTSGARTAI
jgi:hypothetical protein